MQIEITYDELRKRTLFLGLPCYGGMMTAMTARSIADLSALCTHHGIQLRIYTLMNESLIPRARNYITDEFIRSGDTHLMFIDSDIGFNPQDVLAMLAMMSNESEYDVLCGPYPKKSVMGASLIQTQDGIKTIKDIIDSKYFGDVKCLDDNNNIIWRPIVTHSVEPNINNKKWAKLSSYNTKNTAITTYDHEWASIKDPLNPVIEYTPAKDMIGLYAVKTNDDPDLTLYNEDQIKCLIGTSLGSSSLTPYDSWFYDDKNIKEYCRFKKHLLPREKGFSDNCQIRKVRDLIFNYTNTKSVSKILDYVDNRALAVWYMDVGHLNTNCLNLYTYSHEDALLIVDWFNKKYGVMPTIAYEHDYKLKFNAKDSETIFREIAPYIHSSMEYKIPQECLTEKYVWNNKCLDISAREITDIEYFEDDSELYDIGVEEYHNFICDDTVVHNCISWEKIKVAVDKGFADENPNDLEKYVGDYVFNLANGTGSFKVNEPVEVLESGTGFMMIKRDALVKFAEAYPELKYKPDHVRTDHFDGTREITAFFDCPIDSKLRNIAKELEAYLEYNPKASRQQILDFIKDENGGLVKEYSKRYLSEDYAFCQWARNIGIKVWLAPWIKLSHTGSYIFGGSLEDIAALGVSATADPAMLKKSTK